MWEDTLDGVVVADLLPKPEDHFQEMIPVNGDGYRLDFYHGPWNRDDAVDYQARIIMAKPCNSFQLTGHCKNGITCHYDHAPMEPRLLKILKQIVHDYPCKLRGACRDKDCHVGHICYNPGCKAVVVAQAVVYTGQCIKLIHMSLTGSQRRSPGLWI